MGGKLTRREEKQMKLFAKIGAVSLIGGVVVALSATGFASAEADEDYAAMKHAQALARAENDVIKLNCVNDKLVQVKPILNMLDEQALEVDSSGDGERSLVFDKVASAAENVHRLREEADQCIGEPVTIGSESSNSFTGPMAPDDPTKGFTGKEIEPPGYASPFN